jgi:hypothetical protein
MSGRLFQFDAQSAEFKSKTKTRAIANRTSNPDRPAGSSELDLHQLAGLQVDPSIELHARAAYPRNQSGHNFACGARDRDEDRCVHMISGVSASVGRAHFELVTSNTIYLSKPKCSRYTAMAKPIVSRPITLASLNRQKAGSLCCADAARSFSIQTSSDLF